jgi:acyl-coenzyme A thioesterase 13
MGNTTIPEFDILQVAGNAPDDIKLQLGDIPRFFNGSKRRQQLNRFGKAMEFRLKLTELSIISKAEEPTKLEGRAVHEIDVAEGKRKLIT